MTPPTCLSPWYVLARLRPLDRDGLEYYSMQIEDVNDIPGFVSRKRDATIMMNLNTAKRARDSYPDSVIVTLCSEEDVKEYGR